MVRILMAMVTMGAALAWGEPRPVEVQPAEELLVHLTAEAPATVVSLNDSDLSPSVAGVVVEIAVQIGQTVKPGDLLLRLDDWEYRQQYLQAKAELERLQSELAMARKQMERTKTLQAGGQTSEEQADHRRTELEGLMARVAFQEAGVESARLRLEKTELRAPFAGVVTERRAQVGAWVAPGSGAVRLVDGTRMELSAWLDQTAALQWEAGRVDKSSIRFRHPGGGALPVQLRVLSPVLEPRSRTQEARLIFSGETLPLPGAAGRLQWQSEEVYWPAWLPVRRQNRLGIFLVKEGKAWFHPLPGAQEGVPALYREPVTSEVVVTGREGLTHEAPVQVKRLPRPTTVP